MGTVKDLLETKGYEIWTTTPQSSLRSALALMAEKHIGALPVIEDEKLAGIFSERDFARHAVEFNQAVDLDIAVSELMTSPVYFIEPDQTVEDCMVVMTAKKLRHLPVLSEGKLIGMVSIGDVVKDILADKQSKIDVLEHFLWVNLI
jgi:CBS domain-containing protein